MKRVVVIILCLTLTACITACSNWQTEPLQEEQTEDAKESDIDDTSGYQEKTEVWNKAGSSWKMELIRL